MQFFFPEISNKVLKYGFILNPYDKCVSNKMVKEQSTTVVWHVDDINMSHKDMFEVTNFDK